MRCVRVPAVTAALLMLAPAVALPSSARAEIFITVSKADQRVAVDVDGAERYRWPVSTGRRGYDTPSGSFSAIRMERSWYSRKYDWAPMPHAIFFYKGYAMHGTVEERHLGHAASHGCVRLSRVNATILFALLRERGKSAARIEVIDGRLPGPMVDPRVNIAEAKPPLPRERKVAVAKVETKVETRTERKAEAKVPARTEARLEPKPEPKVHATPVAARPPARPAHVEQPLPHKARIIAATPRPAKARIEIVRGGAFTSVGDDAAVMRGREAWLRSLDRKYGIVR